MRFILSCILTIITISSNSQKLDLSSNYFVDGYHGGIYGHYPLWVTQFMADNLEQQKDWKLNLEIEPDTWDIVAAKDPINYERIKNIISDSSVNANAEYVNPTYAQSYLFNTSAESIIRQFQYGMEKLREHFPTILFTTYSSEEPCFTTALPQILNSFGIRYVSLKNPNTCWGGYVKAYGDQSLYWIGPDGSEILTVPRYFSESLETNSTWQTIAWNHSPKFLNAAKKQGIQYPVGMCLQDAGWKNGPWLNHHKSSATEYTTWRNYFNLIQNDKNIKKWRLNQEDINVSLVWGAQILQRIAQQERAAENKVRIAEKLAALATLYQNVPYPAAQLDSAWKKVLLSQHHDCWIVPYNKLNNKTWAENVAIWTTQATQIAEKIIEKSSENMQKKTTNRKQKVINVYNPTSYKRKEIISIQLNEILPKTSIIEHDGKEIPVQLEQTKSGSRVLFKAEIAPLSCNTYQISNKKKDDNQYNGAFIHKNEQGDYIMETDLYRLKIDSQKGSIRELIAKHLNNKNFISPEEISFNTLRGYFYQDRIMAKSIRNTPVITIIENGPLQIKIQINNSINGCNYTQTINLAQGDVKIDMNLQISYKKEIGIGDSYMQDNQYMAEARQKAFYNDTSKLLLTFPTDLKNQKIFKDAPLDVTKSSLSNTFYNRWDEIKNNVLLNWVDVVDEKNQFGLAVLSDHVTSYSHGNNFPLSLTVQYAGIGLWGRKYAASDTTNIHYALIPHKGNWKDARLNEATTKWNAPLFASLSNYSSLTNSFVKTLTPGIEISAIYYNKSDLYIRLMNIGSQKVQHTISLNCYADRLTFTDLNDNALSYIKLNPSRAITFSCDIPLFGFKTIKLTNAGYKSS